MRTHVRNGIGVTMCGIFGFVGKRDGVQTVINGLKALEYRGYDSCGIAVVSNPTVNVKKAAGRIDVVSKRLDFESLSGNTVISHTRWATHGGVTDENAHPHVSKEGRVAIVHNGIIDNYISLKNLLLAKGYVFKSETDSEIVTHLIEDYLHQGNSFEDAFFKTINHLKGSYAILAVSSDNPDTLLAVKRESPLVIGVGPDEYYIASDTLPFLKHTKNVYFMDEDEAAKITSQSVEFFDAKTRHPLKKSVSRVEWDAEQASKEGYPHFLIKEINEQPQTFRKALMQDKKKLQKVASLINAAPRVCIVAAGTSRYAAIVGRYAVSEISGKYCDVYMASEFQYFVDKIGKDALVIAVSQSGETADVLNPVRKAKKNGCNVVSLVNVVGSSLDTLSDVSLYLNCGPEVSVASTKAFTAQVTVMYMIAYTLAYTLDENIPHLEALADKIHQVIVDNEPKIKELAKRLSKSSDIYYLARAINFAVASEGALKMKEISYIHAEGMPAGELKHGTLALISKDVPVVCIAPHDYTYEETVNNVHEVKARGGFTIGITDYANGVFDVNLVIPKVDSLHYPLLANIPCQLLAYYTALACGRDIDKPRNLAKSVTVT
ncbi:glutamine--fructose-6-phosphate transaminase (isomerizing) [archaeon CG10_big_fil_rev_8_21_14_0_10_43_11]|nr:MAG: glutamine--fructose-6-phosphate transaminase (isomerizing) [archaeon CG10_big_fil_rev_8_21_14_0_10_43_11]